jgi:hypothetical protein
MVSVTGTVVTENGALRVIVAEWVPPASPVGSTLTVTVPGLVLLEGDTESHGAPESVTRATVKVESSLTFTESVCGSGKTAPADQAKSRVAGVEVTV